MQISLSRGKIEIFISGCIKISSNKEMIFKRYNQRYMIKTWNCLDADILLSRFLLKFYTFIFHSFLSVFIIQYFSFLSIFHFYPPFHLFLHFLSFLLTPFHILFPFFSPSLLRSTSPHSITINSTALRIEAKTKEAELQDLNILIEQRIDRRSSLSFLYVDVELDFGFLALTASRESYETERPAEEGKVEP